MHHLPQWNIQRCFGKLMYRMCTGSVLLGAYRCLPELRCGDVQRLLERDSVSDLQHWIIQSWRRVTMHVMCCWTVHQQPLVNMPKLPHWYIQRRERFGMHWMRSWLCCE